MRHPKIKMSYFTIIAAFSAMSSIVSFQIITKQGIAALRNDMHKWVDSGKSSNIVTLVAQKGEILDHDAYGTISKGVNATKDSIFSLMSMTKPISGAAMMTFYEEGKFKLDDLVSQHIPEFGQMKVNSNGTLVPQKTPMTMAQLCSHSAGLPMNPAASGATLKSGVEAMLKSNLAFQPGTDWRYGQGVEVQGYLMEKWAGKDYADIVNERLLQPLGMNDTNFWVPSGKGDRVIPSALPPPVSKPGRIIPSYGLHGTVEDYFKFCQMILNGGEYKGRRYVKKETVELMRTNVLAMDQGVYVKFTGGGRGIGFGQNFAVVVDPTPTKNAMPKGSFFWGGAFGTWFWIDPINEIVVVGMTVSMGQDNALRQLSAKAIYDSLPRPNKQ
jgi:CubicO group peptidase (beta-lactamase class C family)